MNIKWAEKIKKERIKFINYKMKKKDKRLLNESIIITSIYLLSFLILSFGRVQQEFLGISSNAFSSIQIITLTFFFAILITLVLYFFYKKATQ